MVVGQRIESLLAEKGWSQAELARRVGVSQQTIWKLISGHSQGSKHIYAIARELGSSPEYLLNETGNPSILAADDRPLDHVLVPPDLSTPEDDNLVPVQEIDLKFGMGETVLDIPVTTEVRRFDRSWLRQFTTAAPSELFFAQGIGDSMMPTLYNSDILLIDTSQKSLKIADQIWAVAMHGNGMIKRLRLGKDGVRILSDNPNVPDDTAYDGELFLIGRVVAVVRKI